MSNTNNTMQTQTSNALHNAIMEASSKDRLPMLALAIERLKQGESINVQDLKTNLYWKFRKFTSQDGESLESYYSRFYKMMNELVRNQCNVTNHQVNVQFLLQLQPEWQRFMTLVKQSQELKIVSYHKLYDILKQHQNEVNEIRVERLACNVNPLALVAQQQPVYHPQNHPTHYTQNSSTRSKQAATRNRGKAIVNSPPPIYDQEPSMIAEDGEMSKDKEIDKLMALISLSFKKIYKPTNNNLRTSSNTKQAYWKDDTDDESEDQELEARYMYMAKLQEVTPDAADNSGPIFDTEPVQQVQNNDNYNVFAIESKHPKQPQAIHDTYLIEQDEHNVIIDSLDMSYDREQADQDDADDLDNERELLASLIEKLKCEINDSKNCNKFLETSNKTLVDKLKGIIKDFKTKNKSLESSNKRFKEANNELSETNKMMYNDIKKFQAELDSRNDAQIKLYKSREDKEIDKVIALENKVKVLDNIVYKTGQSVQTMNMLNRNCKTSFAKPKFLKKAQRTNPCMYDISCYNDNLALMLAPESDEVIHLEKESRSKLSDLIRPFYFEKLNNLYDLFVPQRKKSPTQRYFSERSRMSHTPVNNEISKESFNKQSTLLEKRMDKSIPWDQQCKSSIELFKIKKCVGTIFDGVERCKQTIAKRTYFGHIDPFIQNTIEGNFYPDIQRINNGVNSKNKIPKALPISSKQTKCIVNQSVAKHLRRTVASESTNQKPRETTRKLYESVSKTCSWWYPKFTPPGHKWKPKSQIRSANSNVSMPLGNASRTANILEHMTSRCSNVSNTTSYSNYYAARRDNPIRMIKLLQFLVMKIWIKEQLLSKGFIMSKVLNHNLFSVGQFCDADLEVSFRKSTCYIRDLKGNDLLTGSRGTDLYSITLQDTSSTNLIFLMAKATSSQAWLWHRRLSHLNFDTVNLLLKNDIVIGLPKLKFVKNHLCSSCELGKAKRKSFQTKITPSSKRRLQLLHMDLCSPMRVESINGKKYVLVIVDDYSRYTWTYFLRSKDETPEVLIDFLRLVQRGLHAQVRTVRTDKGTEFLNKTLHAYFATEGINHQTSVARTPEQNSVVEIQNRTLVEVARTMLSATKVSLFFWAKAIATTCFTQNRSLVIP
nr:retrovirus-related Pol polyprotein from transposon TNT 1-94 [Tanacetum cinerariifolium]